MTKKEPDFWVLETEDGERYIFKTEQEARTFYEEVYVPQVEDDYPHSIYGDWFK